MISKCFGNFLLSLPNNNKVNGTDMFIFRGECLQDVLRFLGEVGKISIISSYTFKRDPVWPDVDAKLDVVYLSLLSVALLL